MYTTSTRHILIRVTTWMPISLYFFSNFEKKNCNFCYMLLNINVCSESQLYLYFRFVLIVNVNDIFFVNSLQLFVGVLMTYKLSWCPTCVFALFFFSCVACVVSFSGLSIFIAPSVFSNIYLKTWFVQMRMSLNNKWMKYMCLLPFDLKKTSRSMYVRCMTCK